MNSSKGIFKVFTGAILLIFFIALSIISSSSKPVAGATDFTDNVSLSHVATFKSIGAYLSFSGDLNQNNQAVLEYRRLGESFWNPGHPMDVFYSDSEWRSSLVGLDTNTVYELRATITDPDGVIGTNPVFATVKTRDEVIPLGTGNSYYVSPEGSDASSGSESEPFQTVQKALNTVQAGDTVFIKAGTYQEALQLKTSGTETNYITITNYQNDEVFLDGNSGAIVDLLELDGASYVRIAGLTLRNAYSDLIIILGGAQGVVIENNSLIDPAFGRTGGFHTAIQLRESSGYAVIRHNTIHRNIPETDTDLRGIGWWKAGEGLIIYDNVFTGGFGDGIGGGPEDSSGLTNNIDIYDNLFDGACYDDAIQIEGANKNSRVWNNEIRNCFVGIALAPSKNGPLYIFRNVVYDNDHPVRSSLSAGVYKLGDDTYSPVYAYHNTYYGNTPGVDGYQQTNPGLGGMTSKNNIIRADWYVYEVGEKNAPHDFDYNALYTTYSKFAKWKGTRYTTYEDFKAASGQEKHGIEIDPLTEWLDPVNKDFRLKPESVLNDIGVTIPGFNDAYSAWPSVGAGPDIGAFEQGYGASIFINGGAKYTGSASVTLNLSCVSEVGVKDVRYSDDGVFDSETFEAFTTTKSWTLSSGDGSKTIWYECRDIADEITTSSDTIILETTPPTEPSGLTADSVSQSSIDLSWTASSDSESGISGYIVYRDSVFIASVIATNYSDTGLGEQEEFTYQVSAVNGFNMEGPQSPPLSVTTLADTTPPTVSNIATDTLTSLIVSFSEPVESTSASNVANYGLDNGASVLSASLNADLKTVTLTTSALAEGSSYLLSVANIKDRAKTPNTIITTQVSFVIAADLVGYWKFDDGSGSIATDSAGGNDGALINMDDSDWVPGKIGTALDFDGVNDYVNIGNILPNGSSQLTLEAWVFRRGTGDDRIIAKSASTTTSDPSYIFSLNARNSEPGMRLTGTSFWGGTIPVGEWYHQAITYDGSTLRIYINGSEVASRQKTGDIPPSNVIAVIGNNDAGLNNRYWDGLIDEVRIYSRALTDAEIAQHYAAGEVQPANCPILSGFTAKSRDLLGDGLCEDLNGNGRFDFADVVAFFENLNAPEVQDNWTLFDFNKNGRVDMDDVISLFDIIVQL